MPIPAPFLAAAVQFEPTLGDRKGNLRTLLKLTEGAAIAGAKLIVLPEMATTGYCFHDRAEIAPHVEPIPGPTTAAFSAICAAHDCWIVLGMPEVLEESGTYYNSAVLLGPSGVEGLYRKTHAYISDPKWAKDGDLGLPVFDTPLGRIGIAICMDAAYPETFRIPALRGADIIAFPTNWLTEKAPSPTWWARAVESGVYVIAANRWGLERGVQFDGGSCIIDPDGTILNSVDDGDAVITATIDPARARTKRPHTDTPGHLFDSRRHDAYTTLTLNTYLWNPTEMHGLYGHRPLPAGRKSRIGVLQMEPHPGNAGANLATVASLLATRAARGLDLVVLPEFALCGQPASKMQAGAWAEPIPGPSTIALAAIAQASDCRIVAAMIERDGRRLFNTAVLIGPHGPDGAWGVESRYRKLHLTDSDATWATPGNLGLPTVDTPLGRIGMLIGFDALFPEAARVLALDGADLIACPSMCAHPAVAPWGETAIPQPAWIDAGPTDDHFHLWRERSRENNTYVAFANTPKAGGWSGIFSPGPEDEPRRDVLVRGTDFDLATTTMDTTDSTSRQATNPVRAKPLLRMRQPIWYDPLHVSPESWLLGAPPEDWE